MPPRAITGEAVIDALPEADTAALALEFVATPQPKSTVLFPWKVMPVT
jgi:hypothetical protein